MNVLNFRNQSAKSNISRMNRSGREFANTQFCLFAAHKKNDLIAFLARDVASISSFVPKAILTIVTALTLLANLAGCGRKTEAPTEAQPVITSDSIAFPAGSPSLKNILTTKVEASRDRELNIPGRLVWDEDRTVRVFTPFAGRVSKVIANVGDRVVQGQALAELQSPDFAIAQTDARKAATMLTLANQSLSRVKELVANGIAAGKDLHQAQFDFANAEAEANRAYARLKLYGNTQAVDQRFRLASPVAGTVVERNLNPGQELRPDQPTAPQFVVTDPGKLWVQLDATEADLKFLKPGTPLHVYSNQYPDEIFTGELKQIADFIDPVSRTLKLRGALPNLDRRLKAEMFVNARVPVPRSEFPTVPDKAVFLDGKRRFVFLKIGAEKYTRKEVNIILDTTSTANAQNGLRVTSGVKEGDEVVVSGNLFMQQMLSAAAAASPIPTTTNAKASSEPSMPIAGGTSAGTNASTSRTP